MGSTELIFDRNGYLLPYDAVPTDWGIFTYMFGGSDHRRSLLSDYEHFLVDLRSILPINHRQWIDGSFISKQETPGDIDIIIFIPHTQFPQTTDHLKQLKKEWVGRIDCYFVETFPEGHQKYEIGRADELDWYHFLRTDRRKRPKGVLELQFNYGNQ